MAPPRPEVSLEHGRIRLGGAVFVYLERTFAPPGPLPPAVTPRAYGVAPAVMSEPGLVLAGLCDREAVWLGFQPLDRDKPIELRVRVEGDTGPEARLVCPPDHSLPGARVGEGHVPFTDGELEVGVLGDPRAEVTIRLLPAQDFTKMTGVPVEPIDPDSAYKGYRLP